MRQEFSCCCCPLPIPCQMHQVYTTGHPGISGMDQKLACKTCIVGNTQKATPFLSGLGEHFTKAIKENIILLNSLRQKHAYNQVQQLTLHRNAWNTSDFQFFLPLLPAANVKIPYCVSLPSGFLGKIAGQVKLILGKSKDHHD